MNAILQYNIKKQLRNQGKELKDLYEMLGITKSSYHSRVSGNITLNNLMQIAEAIGCPVDILLKDPRKEGTPQQPQFELKCPSCGAPLELVNKVTTLQDIDSNVDAKEL